LKDSFFKSLLRGIYFGLFAALLVLFYFRWRGRDVVTDDFVRGSRLGTTQELKKAVSQRERQLKKRSPFSINGIPFPPLYDTRNMALIGSPGVGKSTVYRELLSQFRAQGKKAVIYDISGEFTRKFYRPGIDYILNPKDARCAQWSVWNEGKEEDVYSSIANSLIKESHSDPFWHTAPRLVFRAIISNMGKRNASPTMRHLSNILTRMSNEKLAAVCAATPARAVFNLEQDKTTASIRSIMTTYTEVLSQIRDSGRRLSLFEWAKRDDDSCIFLTCQERDKELMAPIITMWFELVMKGILSLDVDDQDRRRIYLFLDELPSLQKIPSLRSFLAQARKYGGGAFLGLQSKTQLEEVYGDKGAAAITDVIGSYLIFRCDGPEGAEWASKVLSSNETDETKDGVSFGANDMRDGVNLGNDKRERRLVMASQIMGLEDLEFYIKLGRKYPVVETATKHKHYPDVAEAIAPYVPQDDQDDEHDAMAPGEADSYADPETESDGGEMEAHQGHQRKQAKQRKTLPKQGAAEAPKKKLKQDGGDELPVMASRHKQEDDDQFMQDADMQGLITLEDMERMNAQQREYEQQQEEPQRQQQKGFDYTGGIGG
jgi:type IV conjugative transfer system coupling protein TraD